MWSVLHWIFLYCLNPNPCMHVISSFTLSILSAKTDDDFKKKDIVPAISLFFMYCAFYLDPKLEHLAFQPWWCVSLIGLRYNEILIFIGGVLTGLYLVVVNPNPTAHIMFNLSMLIGRMKRMSFRARALIHLLCMIIYVNDPSINQFEYKDVLAGLSAVVCAFTRINPDWFTLSMVFTSPIALVTFVLHAINPYWYKMYRNNHFKRVKGSYYFIFTIAVCMLAYGFNFLELKPYIRVFSVSYWV